MKNYLSRVSVSLGVFLFATLAGCMTSRTSNSGGTTLKEAFNNDFLIGVAINRSQFEGTDSRGIPIIKAQFNSISPEDILKWESVHPEPGKFAFEGPDAYVKFGEDNHMFIIGHNLIWHSQTPRWVFEDDQGNPVDRDTLLQRMRDHILTVVGRYKGRIKGWDVVNEALSEGGNLRRSPWQKIIGDDYIEKAFTYAHEADPDAQLYYNDYALENKSKRNGAIALIQKLQAKGIPVTAVGLQGHYKLESPTPTQIDATINSFASLGVKVMITELDVDVNRATQQNTSADISDVARQTAVSGGYTNGLPDSVQKALAARYADLFDVFVKNRASLTRVTFWGVTDGDSWLNSRIGRNSHLNYPLLFDRNGQPKPAFKAVLQTATK